MSYTTPYHTSCADLRWKTCTAYSAFLLQVLMEVRICLSSSVYTEKFSNKIQPFSVQSCRQQILEFKSFTADTRRSRVNTPFCTATDTCNLIFLVTDGFVMWILWVWPSWFCQFQSMKCVFKRKPHLFIEHRTAVTNHSQLLVTIPVGPVQDSCRTEYV